jgi:hypothetical protein
MSYIQHVDGGIFVEVVSPRPAPHVFGHRAVIFPFWCQHAACGARSLVETREDREVFFCSWCGRPYRTNGGPLDGGASIGPAR